MCERIKIISGVYFSCLNWNGTGQARNKTEQNRTQWKTVEPMERKPETYKQEKSMESLLLTQISIGSSSPQDGSSENRNPVCLLWSGNEFRWDNCKSSFSTASRNRMRNLLVFHFLCIRLGELTSLTIVWLEEGFIVFLVFAGRISVSLMFTAGKGLCSSWFLVSVVSDWSMRT